MRAVYASYSRVALVENAVRAVLDLGYRCLLISGGTSGVPVNVPVDDPNLFTVPCVPHRPRSSSVCLRMTTCVCGCVWLWLWL